MAESPSAGGSATASSGGQSATGSAHSGTLSAVIPSIASTGPRRRATTNIKSNVGRREMKEYPLTESDIETLGLTKGGATFFFSAGSLLLGFVLNQFKDASWAAITTSLSSPLPASALGAAVVCFLVGGYLWFRNGSTIRRIKQEVKFDN